MRRVVDEWVFLCIGFFLIQWRFFYWVEFGGKDLFEGCSVNLRGNGCLNIA